MEYTRYEEVGANEREAIAEAVKIAGKLKKKDRVKMLLALERVARAAAIAARKRQTNARYEGRRRRLVGAQVPVELADRVREYAEKQGVSVYRFVMDTMAAACQQMQAPAPNHPPGPRSAPLALRSLSAPRGAAWGRVLPESKKQGGEARPPGVKDCPAEGERTADPGP